MSYAEHATWVAGGISIVAYGFSLLLRDGLAAREGILILVLVGVGGGIAAYGTFNGVEEATRRARGRIDDSSGGGQSDGVDTSS